MTQLEGANQNDGTFLIKTFCFEASTLRVVIFRARMFIFTRHRNVIDKLLNYDNQQNPPNISAASKGHLHIDTQRKNISKNSFIALMGVENVKPSKFGDCFFPELKSFLVRKYHEYQTVKAKTEIT